MKKILFILISITFIFSSCEKEEENTSNNNSNNNNNNSNVYININPDSIIGLWRHDYILQNCQSIMLNPNTNVEVIINESLNNLEVPLTYNPNENEFLFCDLMFFFDENVHRLTDFNDTMGGGYIQIEDLPYSVNGSEIRMVELDDPEVNIDIVYQVIKNTYNELDFDFEIIQTYNQHPDTTYIVRYFGTVNTNRE